MARDERRRQKALARKKAKKQARRRAQQSRTGTFQKLFDGISKSAIREAPIHECLCANTFEQQGIGQVIISRRLTTGDIAMGMFLVDTFCLGAKDGFLRILGEPEYEDLKTQAFKDTPRSVTPPYARKFIENAVAYARQFGFEPPRDFHTAALVFADIDPSSCNDEFVFGKDGKPFYVRGPSETLIRAKQIVEQLRQRCGPDGFHFLVGGPVGGSDMDNAAFEDVFDDDIEDDGNDEGDPDETDSITEEILAKGPSPDPISPPSVAPETAPDGFFRRLFRKQRDS